MPKRTLQGVVVSDKQQKTVVVRVVRRDVARILTIAAQRRAAKAKD